MKPKEDLIEKLEITEEQAIYILDLQLRRISKLDQTKVKKERSELIQKKKQAIAYRDDPKAKVKVDIAHGFDLLTKA